MAKAKPDTESPAPEASPLAGGSYTRDPVTGSLTRNGGPVVPQENIPAETTAPATHQE